MKDTFDLKKFLVENKLTTSSRLLKENVSMGHIVAYNATPEEIDKNVEIFTRAAEKLGFDWEVERQEDDVTVYTSQKKDGPDVFDSPQAATLRKLRDKLIVPFQERQRKMIQKSKSRKGGKKVNVGDQVEYDGDQWLVVGIDGSEVDILEIGNDGYTVQPKDIKQKNPKKGDIVDGPGIDSYRALVVGIDEDGIDVI